MVSDDWFSEGETTAVRIPATVNAPREQRVSQVWQWVRTLTACCVPSRFGRLVIALTSLNIAAAFCLLMEPVRVIGGSYSLWVFALFIVSSFLFTIICGRFSVRERIFLICNGMIVLAALAHSWTRAQYVEEKSSYFSNSNTAVLWPALFTLVSILFICFVALNVRQFRFFQRAWASLFQGNRLFWGCLGFILVGMLAVNAYGQGILPSWQSKNEMLVGVLGACTFFSFVILPTMVGGAVKGFVQLLAVWISGLVGMTLSRSVLGGRVIPLSQIEIMSLYGLLFVFIIWPLFQTPTAFQEKANPLKLKWARWASNGTWATLLFLGLFLVGFLFAFDIPTLIRSTNSLSPLRWTLAGFNEAQIVQRLKGYIVAGGINKEIYVYAPDDAKEDHLSRLPLSGYNFMFCRLENFNSKIDMRCLAGDSRYYFITNSQLSTRQLQDFADGSSRLYFQDVDIIDDGSPPLERIVVNDVFLMSLSPGGVAGFFSISRNWDVTAVHLNPGSVTISSEVLTLADWEAMLEASRKMKSRITFMNTIDRFGKVQLPVGLQTHEDDRLTLQVAADADLEALRKLLLFINSTHIRLVISSSIQLGGNNPKLLELSRARARATYDAVWSTWGGYDSLVYDDEIMKYWETTMITPEQMLELYLAFGPLESPYRDIYLPDHSFLDRLTPESLTGVKTLIVDTGWIKGYDVFSQTSYMSKQFPKNQQFLWPTGWSGNMFPDLEKLHLDSEVSVKNFSFLLAMPNLRELKINSSSLTPGEFAVWAKGLQGLTQLETLYCDGKLDGNQIAVIKRLPSLKRLVLNEDFVEDIEMFRKRETIPATVEIATQNSTDYIQSIPDSFLEHRRRVMDLIREKYEKLKAAE